MVTTPAGAVIGLGCYVLVGVGIVVAIVAVVVWLLNSGPPGIPIRINF